MTHIVNKQLPEFVTLNLHNLQRISNVNICHTIQQSADQLLSMVKPAAATTLFGSICFSVGNYFDRTIVKSIKGSI